MDDKLFREATEDTPKVEFDKINNIFEITGRSLPEDATKFFDPLHDWLAAYCNNPNPKTEIMLQLDYYNSASAKQLVDLLIALEEIHDKSSQVKILWHYNEEDELMKIRGEEIQTVLELPFELVEV